MSTKLSIAKTKVSKAEVKALLTELGYVLWLSRRLAAEMRIEKCQPIQPEMAEFCAVDMAAFAA